MSLSASTPSHISGSRDSIPSPFSTLRRHDRDAITMVTNPDATLTTHSENSLTARMEKLGTSIFQAEEKAVQTKDDSTSTAVVQASAPAAQVGGIVASVLGFAVLIYSGWDGTSTSAKVIGVAMFVFFAIFVAGEYGVKWYLKIQNEKKAKAEQQIQKLESQKQALDILKTTSLAYKTFLNSDDLLVIQKEKKILKDTYSSNPEVPFTLAVNLGRISCYLEKLRQKKEVEAVEAKTKAVAEEHNVKNNYALVDADLAELRRFINKNGIPAIDILISKLSKEPNHSSLLKANPHVSIEMPVLESTTEAEPSHHIVQIDEGDPK